VFGWVWFFGFALSSTVEVAVLFVCLFFFSAVCPGGCCCCCFDFFGVAALARNPPVDISDAMILLCASQGKKKFSLFFLFRNVIVTMLLVFLVTRYHPFMQKNLRLSTSTISIINLNLFSFFFFFSYLFFFNTLVILPSSLSWLHFSPAIFLPALLLLFVICNIRRHLVVEKVN
jgi:hypothetical protein